MAVGRVSHLLQGTRLGKVTALGLTIQHTQLFTLAFHHWLYIGVQYWGSHLQDLDVGLPGVY